MTETKFTPLKLDRVNFDKKTWHSFYDGEPSWCIQNAKGSDGLLVGGEVVAVLFGSEEQIKSDGNLLSAAPDLYEALELTRREIMAPYFPQGMDSPELGLTCPSTEVWRAIENALAKARGEDVC